MNILIESLTWKLSLSSNWIVLDPLEGWWVDMIRHGLKYLPSYIERAGLRKPRSENREISSSRLRALPKSWSMILDTGRSKSSHQSRNIRGTVDISVQRKKEICLKYAFRSIVASRSGRYVKGKRGSRSRIGWEKWIRIICSGLREALCDETS